MRSTVDSPTARARVVAREEGLAALAAISWSRFWMSFAGVPVLRRPATRLAAAFCRPAYGRYRLARYHSRGWVSPKADLSHRALELGRNVFIDDRVLVYGDRGGGRVRLGDGVHLNADVQIITGVGGSVEIGAGTHLQPRSFLVAYLGSIRIGNDVQIAPHCGLYPYDHGIAGGRPLRGQEITTRGDIVVEDDAWLGFGVTLLSGVTIGTGTVVGAGSVVTKSLPAGVVAAGSPARIVGERS
jgi:acetyltransferase-like isoleucine patch superfamily enzyme